MYDPSSLSPILKHANNNDNNDSDDNKNGTTDTTTTDPTTIPKVASTTTKATTIVPRSSVTHRPKVRPAVHPVSGHDGLAEEHHHHRHRVLKTVPSFVDDDDWLLEPVSLDNDDDDEESTATSSTAVATPPTTVARVPTTIVDKDGIDETTGRRRTFPHEAFPHNFKYWEWRYTYPSSVPPTTAATTTKNLVAVPADEVKSSSMAIINNNVPIRHMHSNDTPATSPTAAATNTGKTSTGFKYTSRELVLRRFGGSIMLGPVKELFDGYGYPKHIPFELRQEYHWKTQNMIRYIWW